MTEARLRGAAVVALVLGGLVVGSTLLPALARADDGDTANSKTISVVVLASSPTTGTPASPSPSASPSASGSARPTPSAGGSSSSDDNDGSSNGGHSGNGNGGGHPNSSTAPGTGPDGEVNVGGVLYVSALSWSYHFSPNPFDGSLDLAFTVRNEYTRAIDGDATFWLTNLFGGTVGVPATVAVTGIKPDETRLVHATIAGVGQWTFLTGHATFTPPPRLGGTVLLTVTRQSPAFVLPWAVLVTVALGSGWFAYRRFFFRPAQPTVAAQAAPTPDAEAES